MNYNKLTEELKVYEEKRADLIKQFNEYVNEISPFIKNNYECIPNPEKFANWFINNHQAVLKQKRRIPFVLNVDYIYQYCYEFNKEMYRRKLKQSHNLNHVTNEIYEYEHFDTIMNYLIELFSKDNCITEEIVFDLAKEASEILRTQSKISNFEIIKRNELNTKQESISYCYYLFYELNKKSSIRKIYIEYLLEKFQVFSESTYKTINSHFKDKPLHYPL